MRGVGGVDDAVALEFHDAVGEVVEQPGALTEQDRREVDVEFVDQPGGQGCTTDAPPETCTSCPFPAARHTWRACAIAAATPSVAK